MQSSNMKKTTIFVLLVSVFVPSILFAQGVEDLKKDATTSDNVLTYGMGYSQQRFSSLTQINRKTVKRLVPA